MNLRHFAFGILSLCLFISCGNDDDMDVPKEITSYDTGIFVVNQGNNDVANGSISFYQRDCEQVVNKIYLRQNTATTVGNQLQAIAFEGDQGYILSEQANALTVVHANDFSHIATITGFRQPKGLLVVNQNKLYVSEWGADGYTGSIQVVDLNTLSIVGNIPTSAGAGKMLQVGPAVYVANSGGFGVASIVTKIDATTDQVVNTIEVGPNPVDLVQDQTGAIWSLCSGVLINFQNPNSSENTPGELVKIENDEVTHSIPLVAGARNLTINTTKDELYFVNNNWTYAHPIANTSLSLVPFLDASFNAYAVDPVSGYLLAANAMDFKDDGTVILFDLNTANPIDTFEVGIVPIGFGFR